MNNTQRASMAAAVFAAVPCAAEAGYTLGPIIVHGVAATSVNAISSTGVLGGVFINATSQLVGFLLSGKTATILKPPRPNFGFGPLTPTGIAGNKFAGTQMGIAGYIGFSGRNGKTTQTFNFYPTGAMPYYTDPVSINTSGVMAFNSVPALPPTSYTGKSAPFQQLTPPCDFPHVLSLNDADAIAGRCLLTTGNPATQLPRIFRYVSGVYSLVTGPGGTNAYGGYINNAGDIAGTYAKANGSLHGFVLINGTYQSFDAPVPVTAMAVGGFSNTGYVAGTYTDTSGAQHGFVWRGGQFSELIPNPSSAQGVLVVGVSDAGDVALDVLTGPILPIISAAYLAHCSGAGC